MATLQDSLEPEENLIEQFDGINYQKESYNCAVTNLNVFLYGEGKKESIKFGYNSIENVSLEKEWYIDLFYLIPVSFALAFVFLFVSLIIYLPLHLTPPQVWPPADATFLSFFLYPGIACAMLGIGAVVAYLKIVKYSLLISGPAGDFQLFAKYENLLRLNLIIKNIKFGRSQSLREEGIFEFTGYIGLTIRIFSNILIGISVFLFVLIGWMTQFSTFRTIFYIPFLLLLIGAIMALMSYEEKKIKKNYFKVGFLLIFLGMNCILFQSYTGFLIYIDTFYIGALIGFAIVLAGAILYFDSYSKE